MGALFAALAPAATEAADVSGVAAAGAADVSGVSAVTARDKSPATRGINGGAPMLHPRE